MKRLRWLAALCALVLIAGACGRGDDSSSSDTTAAPGTTADANAPTTTADKCAGQTLEATDVGVSADEITVTVMADVGSPLAPGLFQGNVDALNAYAKYINANGGIGCRKLVVKTQPRERHNLLAAEGSDLQVVLAGGVFHMGWETADGFVVQRVDKQGTPVGVPQVAITALERPILGIDRQKPEAPVLVTSADDEASVAFERFDPPQGGWRIVTRSLTDTCRAP